MGIGSSPFRRTIVIGGKQTVPLHEFLPRSGPRTHDGFKTVNARRKDDDGKWWVAAWHGDGYMWEETKQVSDQVIREDPAVRSSYVRGRGTETSAEVLVGPPWRMKSNAGQQQWY